MLDSWYLENLVCPRDHEELLCRDGKLNCPSGHLYPVVDGVPVMLLNDVLPTLNAAEGSLSRASSEEQADQRAPGLYLESLAISAEEKAGVIKLAQKPSAIDPVVAYLVGATNGLMYKHLIGQLVSYPIPTIPLPDGNRQRLLDVGCSWGRWSVAASRKGYDVVGLDPSLGAVMAARRVARQLGQPNHYVVGDARFLPFRPGYFDRVFSYSVIQHFSRPDARHSVNEMGRALRGGGMVTVQMPTSFGIRCLYHQTRRLFRDAVGFEVRYWTLRELRNLFSNAVGLTQIYADCFFGIGLQSTDAALMPWRGKVVLAASEYLRWLSCRIPTLVQIADSVFVQAVKRGA